MNAKDQLKAILNVLGVGDSQQEQTPTAANMQPQNNADAVQAAIVAERQRVAALDAMKNGNPAVDSIIETAKANGATAESIKPYVDAIPQEQPTAQTVNEEKMLTAIKAILADNNASGAAGVLPTPQSGQKNKAAEKAANIEEVANYGNKLMGVK